MISKLEERGNCAYIVEDGVSRIIPWDEYVIKLEEFTKQNTKMDQELNKEITPDIENTIDSEIAPETPEIADGEELTPESTETPVETENAPLDENNAPVGEDTPAEEAHVE